MKPASKKLEISIFIAAFVIITAVWAFNGYEDTWLYVTALIIAIPTTWFFAGRTDKGQ